MAKFYLIRHGKPDYTYGDTHGFIDQGHDFAPLKTERIEEVIEMAKDKRLKNENKKWETKEHLRARVMSVINKYKDTYDTIIIVAHKMAFQSICDCGDMKPAQIFEIEF